MVNDNSLKNFLLLVLFLYSITFSKSLICPQSENRVKVISQTTSSITLELSASNYITDTLSVSGKLYSKVNLKNFGRINSEGYPSLPCHTISLVTDHNPDISITVLDSEYTVINNILVYPAEKTFPTTDGPHEDPFAINESIYSNNSFYPANSVTPKETATYYGIPFTRVALVPMQHNPVAKELKVFNKLVVRIDYTPCPQQKISSLNSYKAKLINNMAINQLPAVKFRSDIADTTIDVLILTRDKFVAAAETLAVWQRQKGYDVHIKTMSDAYYTSADKAVKDFYQNTAPSLSYLIIIGDDQDIKAYEYKEVDYTTLSTTKFASDAVYRCLDGKDDTYPDLAGGRISPSSAPEAMNMVKKIIQYEKNPPTEKGFYQRTLPVAYYQDGEDFGKKPDSYEDRAMVGITERVKCYLDDTYGYSSKRVYFAKSNITPLYHNKTNFGNGEPLPDYLKRPNFAWDGDAEDIISQINNGCFLVYHYDHGSPDGWSQPAFKQSHIPELTNNGLLPLIYSMDCNVGLFTGNWTCFSEAITRYSNGGAIGIIAASYFGISGPADVLLLGMIDATWPGDEMVIYSGTVTPHEPIYRMGDILNQGLIRMGEQWDHEKYVRWHRLIFHLFGDPTVRLWTSEPKPITIDELPENALSNENDQFNITNLSSSVELVEGVATLYNNNSGKIIGKSVATLGDVAIPLFENPGSAGDTIVLTITAHNCRPLIEKMAMSGMVSTASTGLHYKMKPFNMVYVNNSIKFKVLKEGKYSIKVYEVNGRVLQSVNRKYVPGSYSIPISSSSNSTAMRIISIEYGNNKFIENIITH